MTALDWVAILGGSVLPMGLAGLACWGIGTWRGRRAR